MMLVLSSRILVLGAQCLVLSYRDDALAEVRAKVAKIAKGGDGICVRRGERLLGRLRRWLRVIRFLKEGVLA